MIYLSDRLATEKADSSPAFRHYYADDSLMENEMLTQERLKELLLYTPETGVFIWRVNKNRNALCGQIAGSMHSHGYIVIKIDCERYYAHRLAWLYVFGEWPRYGIDHINGARDDNSIINLRDITQAENKQNQTKPNINNSVKCLGVSRSGRRFRAQIMISGESIELGKYDTREDAHAAYLAAKRELHPFSIENKNERS